MSRFIDRVPASGKDGRIRISNAVTTGNEITGVLELADDATVQGTILNAATLNQMETDLKAYTDNACSQVSENSNRIGAVPLTGGVMTGQLSVPKPLVINSAGGDTAEDRLIKAYRQSPVNYINFGHSPSKNNCGELMFNYVGNESNENFSNLTLYGGENHLRVYPNRTVSIRPIYEGGNSSPILCNHTLLLGEDHDIGGNNRSITLPNSRRFSNYKYIIFAARDTTSGTNADYSYCMVLASLFENYFNSSSKPLAISREGARLKLYRQSSTSLYVTDRNYNNRLTIWGVN